MTAGSPVEGSEERGASPRGVIPEVPPGTNLLLAGPPLVGKRDLMLAVLARGRAGREATIVVATDDDERSVVEGCGRVSPGFDRSRLAVVECNTGRETDATEAGEGGIRVRRVGSPGDLTGLGIATSELMGEFERAGATGVRLGMDSLSTLLLYADFGTVCRFLHVLGGRVRRADGVGVFVVDPGSLDPARFDQLKTLVGGLIEVREDDGGREIRSRGIPGADGEWRTLPVLDRS